MEFQTHRRELQLLDLSVYLIHEVEENLLDLLQRVEQILNDLKLALDILALTVRTHCLPRLQHFATLRPHLNLQTVLRYRLSTSWTEEMPKVR
jgi:hypothetical protein